ncbi:penicillin-binding protein [Thermotoga sp. KOL6]|nr:penicillin-binding protein [Thermotoga sp. KOL6]
MKTFFGIVIGFVAGGLFFLFVIKLYQDQFVTVPDVTGLSGTEACEKLKEFGLICDKVASGTVIDTYPHPGSKVKKGRTVNLYYENPLKRIIPHLSGIKLSVAEEILKKSGWKYEIIYFPFGEEESKVLAIYPTEGIPHNGTITLLVDTGKKDTYFFVQNYVGMKFEELKTEDRFIFIGRGSRVVGQYPPPNSIAKEVILILGEE